MRAADAAKEATSAIPALLQLLVTSTDIDGAILLRSPGESSQGHAIESYPPGYANREFSPLPDMMREVRDFPVPAAGLHLPSAMTRWLGDKVKHVSLHPVSAVDFAGFVLSCWRDVPRAPEASLQTLTLMAPILSELVGRHSLALRQREMQGQIDAVMQNVAIGVALVNSTGVSLINPIAADLLGLRIGAGSAADLAAAMRARRGECAIHDSKVAGFAAEHLPAAEGTEYWVFPGEERVVLVESRAFGHDRDPGRVWVFTDVKPLWTLTAQLKAAVGDLQHSNQWLESEVKRRLEAEAKLRRHASELQVSHTTIERRAKEATELAALLEQQKAELEISKQQSDFLANHDPLTGLMNRRAYYKSLERMIAAIRGSGAMVAVMFIDLDKFKSVNDTLGHEAGDDLLKTVAGKLKAMLRETDVIARFGGDEFALATPHAADQKIVSLRLLADRLRDALQIPVPAPGGAIEVCATLGIAVAPLDGYGIDQLVARADQAMYAGKRRGRNVAVMFSDLEIVET